MRSKKKCLGHLVTQSHLQWKHRFPVIMYSIVAYYSANAIHILY